MARIPAGRLRIAAWQLLLLLAAALIGAAQDEALDPAGDSEQPALTAEKTFLKGSVAFYEDRYADCLDRMEETLELDPEFNEAYLVKGMALMMLGRMVEACRDFTVYGDRDPMKPEGYNMAGKLLFDYGHYAEAESFFQKSLDLSPDDPGFYNNFGSVLVKMGKLDEAREVFEKGLALDPNVPELSINMGIVYFIRNDLEAAERAFLKAIELNANLDISDPIPYANLGDVYFEDGDMGGAARAYCTSLELDATQSDVRTRLGMALQILGEPELAKEQYETAIAAGGELPQAHSNLAVIFLEEGRIKPAVREYKEAVRMTAGRHEIPLEELARILDRIEQWDEALKYYRMAFAVGARSAAVLSALSRLCEQRDANEEALAYFRLLEDRSALDPTALLEVAKRCTLSGIEGIRDPARGLEISHLLAERTDWSHPGVLDTLALAYAHVGDFEKAATFQQSAITLTPPDSLIFQVRQERLESYVDRGN
jgi:tetratricopeptide (TPR) repeat protein